MQIFLYEFITGGGMYPSPAPLAGALLAEGSAMIAALAADFCRLDGVEVTVMRDARLSTLPLPGCTIIEVTNADQHRDAFDRLSSQSDWTLLIAPEFDGILLSLCRQVDAGDGKLLGPSSEFVALTAEKHRTAEQLAEADVPTPHAVLLSPEQSLPNDFPYPAVIKPCDGAGSLDVQRIEHSQVAFDRDAPMRLETFCPGMPASVALLCGPQRLVTLPACQQRLSDDGRFEYQGGRLPLSTPLHHRAARLARAAIEAMPPAIGYVGVDLILGDDADGRDDVVIEINPRLTTSYVGLRAASSENLAATMLAIATSTDAELSFRPQTIEFDANGTLLLPPVP